LKTRSLIVLAAIVSAAVGVPAAAQDGAPPAGRFQLAPGEGGGFVRLDTRTGAVSHCRQENGVWRCQPIMDSGLADRLTALSEKVDHLSSGLDRLSLRVDELVTDAGARTSALAPADQTAGRSEGFAQTVVYRLLEMIRTLKHGHADQT
jgi:outer membrane murein-binding lipoprotein Lpp